jgi:tetratricopeptide (TPR) repeat protein
MLDGAGRHAELAGELVEWWEDLCQIRLGSRVVLVAVPPGWGRSTALDRLADAADADDAPVTLIVRISGRELPAEDAGLQAAMLRDRLAGASARHRAAELLGLDRLGGVAQLGLGIGGLFVSGPAAAIGFLVAGLAIGAAGQAWDGSPAGQDGAVARASRAVAAESAQVPVVVIIDDADCLDQDLALTMIENLAARHDGQVLVVAAVDPDSGLRKALVSRARQGITEGLVHTADAAPDMGYESRADLVRELCPALPDAAVHLIARRTVTFADVFTVAAAPRLAEIGADLAEAPMLAAVDAVISAQLHRPEPSAEAVIVAWAGGLLQARQAARALEVLGIGPQPGPDADVLRWEGLERLADPGSPRLAGQIAALANRDRQAMAGALLDEALRIAADPGCGLIDRVTAARAAHRVRGDLADRGRLSRAQRGLAADLEALGEPDAALEVAAQALDEWPDSGPADDREWLAAAVLRLTRAGHPSGLDPLVTGLIADAVAGGAAVGLEARIWAAIDLLDTDGRRQAALDLVDQVTAALDEHADLGPAGDRWRLLLAHHTARAGHPGLAEHLLAPLLASDDAARYRPARAILDAGDGPRAGIRLQNILLANELAALPASAEDDLLRIHHVLAGNHRTLGNYRQALAHATSELQLRIRIQGPEHPATLANRAIVARRTAQAGDYAKALSLSRDLLPDLERILGPDHHETLALRSGIANFTAACGNLGGALDLFRDLLPDMTRALGPDHPDTLATRGDYAFSTGHFGDVAGALAMYQDLLPAQERTLGPDAFNTLMTRSCIAFRTGQSGNARQARELLRDLLPDLERVLGPDHPETLGIRGYTAQVTGECGDRAAALAMYRDLLPDLDRVLGPDHPATRGVRLMSDRLTEECRGAADDGGSSAPHQP